LEAAWGLILGGALYWVVGRRPSWARVVLLVPCVWVSVEWLRSLGDLGIAWSDLGHSQVTAPRAVQFASVAGAYGLSYLIALTNAAIVELLTANARPVLTRVLAVGPPVFLILFGQMVLALHPGDEEDAGGVQVTLVQCGEVNQPIVFGPPTPSMEQLRQFIQTTQAQDIEPGGLVIWPEAAIGADLERDAVLRRAVSNLVRRKRCYLLAGCHHHTPPDRSHNAAILFLPDGTIGGVYHKNRLVIMSEQTPGWLRAVAGPTLDRFGASARSLTPGDGFVVFDAGDLRLAPIICFESTLTYPARRAVSRGANLIALVTNDGWFRATDGGEFHAGLSIMRAVENRTPIARAACTGISMFVDAYGRISYPTPLFDMKSRAVSARIPLRPTDPPGSVYTRVGEVAVWASLAAVVVSGVWGWRRRDTQAR
ncbi:MAG TPA: apolipoprotein N-acyltransferase, partial [Armatimonadota bacterium]|nr:apolipoprotein N-acyltransferase [Armatimonadota bacterium]